EICPHGQIWRVASAFVIQGRSKERSDAAQTRGSMPERRSAPTAQNERFCAAPYSAPPRSPLM
ncbi:MAG: hypothetical protein E5X72_31830, partial [Mesorhizobium sp.]